MKIILFFLFLAASLQAETFGYGDLQAMARYPMAGLGVRIKKEGHALDVSGNYCVWPDSPYFHVKALYIAYPRDQGVYLGAGVGAVKIEKFTGSWEGAIGYQLAATRHYFVFLEGDLVYPFHRVGDRRLLRAWPGVTFGVGF